MAWTSSPSPQGGDRGELLDRCLLQTGTLAVGVFRAHPSHPDFRRAGAITRPLMVFPRRSVWIRHEGGEAFVADPSLVTFYNSGQPYEREAVDQEGDRSDWFAFAPQVLTEALSAYDPGVQERPECPFDLSWGPSDSHSYLLERLVFRHIQESPRPDLLFVEETMLEVLRGTLRTAWEGKVERQVGGSPDRFNAELTQHTKALLARCFRESLSLSELAARVGVSVFHLCRIFRRHAGTSLHSYRNQLRLRAAVDLLDQFRHDLTGLALHLGYSSHSHFTAAFRKAFACTPSAAGKMAPSRLRRLFLESGATALP